MRGGEDLEDKQDLMPEQPSGNTEQPKQEPAEKPVEEQTETAEQETEKQEAEEHATEEELTAEANQAFMQAREQKKTQESTADKDAYAYRWNYTEQKQADKKNRSGKRAHSAGAWIYAGIMTFVFVVCFALLVGVLIYDALMPDRGENTILQGGFAGNVTVIGGGDEQTIEMSALESVRNYTVVITAKTADGVGTGTGFVLTEDGYIATNYHVIEDAQTITVKFYNGQKVVAEVIGYSEIDDLAVIKVNATGLYYASLGSSADCIDGQNVYAVGTPAGEEYAWSVTKGVVSFAQREVKLYDDEGILIKKMKLIQTDTPVNPGNSGGPLVNADGEVLGIITLKLSGQYENMGFAIPIDGAMVILNSIIETGEPGESPITTKRPMLGIVGVPVEAGQDYVLLGDSISREPKDLAAYPDKVFRAQYTGILVTGTDPSLDAANKLQEWDIIVMANDQEIVTMYDLMGVINQHNGGDTIEITYYRNGVANIVEITLGYAE